MFCCSAVLIQMTRVADKRGQTDGIAVEYTRYSMLSRVKMMMPSADDDDE